jgi:hypothetical protein
MVRNIAPYALCYLCLFVANNTWLVARGTTRLKTQVHKSKGQTLKDWIPAFAGMTPGIMQYDIRTSYNEIRDTRASLRYAGQAVSRIRGSLLVKTV